MKSCTVCGENKPNEQFYPNSRYPDLLRGCCKICSSARGKEWRRKNPKRQQATGKAWRAANKERSDRSQRNNQLLRKYGLTVEDYEAIFTAQKGKCRICRAPLAKFTHGTCVDHNHATKEVRGILCRSCNRALGFFHDNAVVVEEAAEYLRLDGAFNLETEREIAKCRDQA